MPHHGRRNIRSGNVPFTIPSKQSIASNSGFSASLGRHFCRVLHDCFVANRPERTRREGNILVIFNRTRQASTSMSKLRQSIWKAPVLKQLRESGTFNAVFHKGFGAYWGHFRTSEEAASFMRSSNRSTYNTDEIVQFNIDLFYGIQFFDWPVPVLFANAAAREQIASRHRFRWSRRSEVLRLSRSPRSAPRLQMAGL